MSGGNIVSNSFLQIQYQLLQVICSISIRFTEYMGTNISTGNMSANITMHTHITKDQWFPNIITPLYFDSNINQKYTFPKHFFTLQYPFLSLQTSPNT